MEPSHALVVLCVVFVLVFFMQEWTQYRSVFRLVVGLVLVVAAITGYFVYRHREQTRQAQDLATTREEFESRIAGFAAKYNAVRGWQKSLLAGKPSTSELAPLLVRPDGRPILVLHHY